ncbi:MAG: mechanosensitive ion channel protein MscS [Croceicoccus sp.]|uniref:mechanosensitive ion channel family protein n=1 Tax=Brevirhabdus sp. TaxID=2004514 RepID=UPI000C0B0DA5|nr:mechanosensitive ion channel protein MscS [Croceicoccus sp.]MAL25462.1 mechanosensitive ion channel protein MscS [Croceicoccus sp.]|tara:strand:+ start:39204 stop:40067 length:864 start_codon:yes stop_codon:yes gene_type:complete
MNYVETINKEVMGMAEGLVASLPSLAIGLVIILVTWLVAKIVVRITGRIAAKANLRESLRNLIATVTHVAVWIIGLMIAATVVLPGLEPAGLIAGLGIGTVAIGFAFQDIFENFLAGVLIMLRENMQIGDLIEVEGVLGKVEKITLRETHIRQLTNELTIMPNSMLFKNPVQILTDAHIRRDELMVGVSYDTDLDRAMKVIEGAMVGIEAIDTEKPVSVFAWSYGASSVDFLVQWWSDARPRDRRETKSDVVRAIKRALDDAGIEIPFPYVTHTFKEPVPLLRDAAE